MSPPAPEPIRAPRLRRLRRSLFVRLSALYLGLLLVAAAAGLWLTWSFANRYVREVEQRVNRPLAETLAHELAPRLAEGLDTPAARGAVRHVQALHPALDLYLLDAEGRIVREFKQQGTPARDRVDLAPIRAFLTPGARLPVLGDDPGGPSGREVFSAAEVTYEGGRRGYLYAVLRGMPHVVAADAVRESYVLRTFGAALAVVLALTAVSGLALFALLTRRLGALAAAVERFRAGDFAPRAEDRTGDEIGRLGTDLDAMADRIRQHIAALHEADDARRALAENVAHDFRNSLAPARTSAELLLADDALDPQLRREALRAILTSTGRLAALADQLAMLSDLDARRVTPRPEPFSAAELAQDVALRFRPEAERLGIALAAAAAGSLMPVHADIGLVERALANLIDNALKNTPPEGMVRVAAEPSGAGVRMVVEDTGHGIAPDELPLVTQRFHRTRQSRERGATGSGLGLAIARELVELHGGALEIESHLGSGTSVAFTLPTHEPLSSALPPPLVG